MGAGKQREVHLYPACGAICGLPSEEVWRWRARGSLGFDFHWKRSRRNRRHVRVRRTTNPKKFRSALRGLKDWLKKSRSLRLPELLATLRRKLRGHWNYYGVIGNSKRLWVMAHHVKRLVFKWLNRRSQRRSFTWASFARAWERWDIPRPRIVEEPLPSRRQTRQGA